MKTNEAPERLYLSKNIYSTFLYQAPDPDDETAVEYTRTDAFIEKAKEWLEKNADKYIWYSDYAECPDDDTCGMNDDFIEDFINYIKGE